MINLIQVLEGFVMATSPILLVAGLLVLAGWRERARDAMVARQIRLTDAIAAELGAVVAPVVTRGHGRWHIEMAVPVERPAMVGRVLAIVDRVLPRPYALVLTPQAPGPVEAPVLVRRGLRAA